MEVCKLVEGQRYNRALNERQAADFMKFSCKTSRVRANKIRQRNGCSSPSLHYHISSRNATIVPRDGKWNLIYNKVATGATLDSWSCVAFGNFEIETILYFIRELVTTFQALD
ncbi:13057_t:CDS:2 [Funneliformis mosseae]|uniref:13057_t:CDS:1 n=1 Tax=Funneliformis mosseae TaxID=27381 RepID=A0A9N9CUA1_FUNMO|nr:13057_t:CDS:2 [Funneliformis mosseae]